ncbi:MAG: hypothetical protein ACK47B_04995 [Armatimonadota bacterium]
MEAAASSPRRKRAARLWLAGSVATLLAVLALGVVGYWAYCQALPPYTPARVRMPSPNAYDDYVAAVALLPAGFEQVDVSRDELPEAELRRWAQQLQPALQRLRDGFPHEYRNPPVLSFTQPFPELAQFRVLGRGLVLTGLAAERAGRSDEAARAYVDCLRLGADVPRGGTLIHGLVGVSIQQMALPRLEALADRLDARTARRLAAELARVDRESIPFDQTLAAERDAGIAGAYELLQGKHGAVPGWSSLRMLSGQTTPPTLPERWMEVQFAFTPKARVLHDYRAYYDALIAEARKPYGTRASPPIPEDAFNRSLAPTFISAHLRFEERDAVCRVIQSRLALRAYRLERGVSPTRLEQLVPRYLPSVPRDPFGTGALLYSPRGLEAQVYSRGPDGDDDGGRLLRWQYAIGGDGDITTASPRK